LSGWLGPAHEPYLCERLGWELATGCASARKYSTRRAVAVAVVAACQCQPLVQQSLIPLQGQFIGFVRQHHRTFTRQSANEDRRTAIEYGNTAGLDAVRLRAVGHRHRLLADRAWRSRPRFVESQRMAGQADPVGR